ncbi:DUF4367 domain-containing protein [Halosimplex salinum]|uniref:DUF4367 domain-containing protein n=1 Tax=Halosimplex salinum TaxID=1710538 RepID=UPI000F47D8D1|nr:DUF4367 domain-containing protein [Halosimplex salinum]
MTDERGSLATRVAPLAVGVVVVALLAVVAVGALPADALSSDDSPAADEILDRVEQRYDSAETLAGDATITTENATAERSANVSFVAEKPNSTRLSVVKNGSEYVVGTNGTVAWAYDPANETVRVRKLPDNESAWNHSEAYGNYSKAHGNHTWNGTHAWADENGTDGPANVSVERLLEENVSAELLRTTTLDGAETYVVGLEHDNESYRGNATLWVDTDDYRVHQFRASYGENRTTVAFDGVQFNASVHESTFRPPDDASVTTVSQERYDSFEAAQEGTDLTLQRLDAEGYDFDGATVVTRAGQTVVAQEYTGDADVSVVATADDLPGGLNATEGESVSVNGENATYVERDDGSAVVWEDDGVTRAVVGDLTRAELVELAEAVR